MNRFFVSVFVLILGMAAGCQQESEQPVLRNIEFRKDGELEILESDGTVSHVLAIEVAEGDSAQARGLMDRRSLPPMSGMLFVGDVVEEKSFWMENTPMPLDIIFIGPDSQVVNIAARTRPYSRENILSDGPAQYVLEIRAGMAERLGIGDSTRFRWSLER